MIKLKNILNEIGEGVTPFPWKRIGPTKVDSWMNEIGKVDKSKSVTGTWEELPHLQYEFKGDKATYEVKIAGGYSKRLNISFGKKPDAPKPPDYNLIIVVAFNVAGSDKEVITNFGEHLLRRTVDELFYNLKARPSLLAGLHVPGIGLAPTLEHVSVPQEKDIEKSLRELISELT
jgi:hypothetical protein